MSDKIQVPAIHSGFKTIEMDNVIFTVGSEVANVINVSLKLRNGDEDLTQRVAINAYLSDDANGDSISSLAPNGGIVTGVDGVYMPIVNHLTSRMVSEANGNIDIDMTHSAAKTWFLVLVLPSGEIVVSSAIVFT